MKLMRIWDELSVWNKFGVCFVIGVCLLYLLYVIV
jgi:hypothetical protein